MYGKWKLIVKIQGGDQQNPPLAPLKEYSCYSDDAASLSVHVGEWIVIDAVRRYQVKAVERNLDMAIVTVFVE